MENRILLTNIQRFSLHDGPGIRTTVFLKGCSLKCPWCSNPENLLPLPQIYIKDNIEGTYGMFYTVEQLIKECLKDKIFYEGKIPPNLWSISTAIDINNLPGGVTFSGGECLLQMPSLIPVCKALHKNSIHVAVETCLFCPPINLVLALDMVDFFYVDMKILDADRCAAVEHGDLELYLKNLDILLTWKDSEGHGKPVVIRIPVIGNYTDDPKNRKLVHDLIGKYQEGIIKVELIKEHNLGEIKYRSLGMNMDYHGVEDSLMEVYKNELSDLGMPTEIFKI